MRHKIDPEILQFFIEEAEQVLVEWESHCLSLDRGEGSPEALFHALFRAAHNIKGTSRSVGLTSMGEFVHQIEDGINALREKRIELNAEKISLLLAGQSVLTSWIAGLRQSPDFSPATEQFLETFRRSFDPGGQSPTEFSPSVPSPPSGVALDVDPPPASANLAPASLAAAPSLPSPPRAGMAPKRTTSPDEQIRVSALKIDQLLQVIGELSIHQNILNHRGDQLQVDAFTRNSLMLLRKIVKDIYERAFSLRMLPIQPLFQRLERAARDLAHDLGKKVEVRLDGIETELDKGVLERIIDPLIHIVRNAVDHGIESPDQRERQGKAVKGTLSISAVQRPEGVQLVIRDDGKGMSRDRILAKAIEKGLVRPEVKLKDAQILELIFAPGFSTTEAVTDVSGRGVGMDVVKRCIDELHGEVRLESQEGKGSSIVISLPTSLSIVDTVIVESRGNLYALPANFLEEVLNLNESCFTEAGRMLQIRGRVVPKLDLGDYLSVASAGHVSSPPQTNAFLVRVGNVQVAIGVDRVEGQQSIVVRPLSGELSRAFGLSGVTILGSGEPAFIVDIAAIVRHFLETTKFHSTEAAA